jgi:hypothetical protein
LNASEAINESIMLSSSETSPSRERIVVGKDSRGHWIVLDRQSQCGGLFLHQKDAIRFALQAASRIPSAPVIVADILQFDMAGAAGRQNGAAEHASARRAA